MKELRGVTVIGLFGEGGCGKDETAAMLKEMYKRRGITAQKVSIGKQPKKELNELYRLYLDYKKKGAANKRLKKEDRPRLPKKGKEAYEYIRSLEKKFQIVSLEKVFKAAGFDQVDFESPALDVKGPGRDFKNNVVREFITYHATEVSKKDPHQFHRGVQEDMKEAVANGATVLIVTDVRAAGQNVPQNDFMWLQTTGGYLIEVRLKEDGSVKRVDHSVKVNKTKTEQVVDDYISSLQKHGTAPGVSASKSSADVLEVEAQFLREHAAARIVWAKFSTMPRNIPPEAFVMGAMMDLNLLQPNRKLDPPVLSNDDPRSHKMRRVAARAKRQSSQAAKTI